MRPHLGTVIFIKPGVHLIVKIAEKSVDDQMDTSLLTIPTIVTIVNDRNDHIDTFQQL